ncbi:hypothetical protein PT974_07472 [Cladobotryum mycophilum]|uniref:Uncharacterized protein n=1 Tax=Cladobotryum mycophilum TaxID=491253 RepID=A0ABR0SPD0_9HYPO
MASDSSAVAVDARPESSPYATDNIKLNMQSDYHLYIPPHLLAKSPELASMRRGRYSRDVDISPDAGHVLVHYLFTDTYQCLRPKGSSPHEKAVAEFLTSIRVYAAARKFELASLEELAKVQIQRLGDELRVLLVFDLVRNEYPNPSLDDVWISAYLKSRLRTLFVNPAEPMEQSSTDESTTVSISDILFKSMFELLRENTTSLGDKSNQPFRHGAEPHENEPLTQSESSQVGPQAVAEIEEDQNHEVEEGWGLLGFRPKGKDEKCQSN